MYLRLSLDPRILLPLLMLGGLATSLATSARPPRSESHRLDAVWVPRSSAKFPETLPALLNPAAVLMPPPALPAPSPWPLLSDPHPIEPPMAPANALANPSPPRSPPEASSEACAEGTILVEGDYCPALGHVCLKQLEGLVERCAEYAAPPICDGPIQKKRFCIDRFEYPNLEGVRPVVMVSWQEARTACEAEGKRLCTGSEWTLACEGSERVPYPYGYTRDNTACNIDKPHPQVDGNALLEPRAVATEVARLDQRVPSGQMARCRSSYGVQDMTGNVDEWVTNERHFGPPPADGTERPFISALKGGYWGPVRNRCRATTTAHDEWFRYYEVGFRCCANAP
jgi:formylglycine-generating enzyme